jgi:hypothetical protein
MNEANDLKCVITYINLTYLGSISKTNKYTYILYIFNNITFYKNSIAIIAIFVMYKMI